MLKIVSAVVARDSVIVRSSVRLEGVEDEGKVVVEKTVIDADIPFGLKVVTGVAKLVGQMVKAGVDGVIIVPDSVFPRMLQAVKVVAEGKYYPSMVLPWMRDGGRLEDLWRKRLGYLLDNLRSAKRQGVYVKFKPASELLRVSLESTNMVRDLVVGETVKIKNGVNEYWGIRVKGNDRFSGDIKLRQGADGVVYGEIVEGSLVGKAVSFAKFAKTAVKAAMAELPQYVYKEVKVKVDAENF